MGFFVFPREIRDIIYTYLAPDEKTYTVTSSNNVTTIETDGSSDLNLGGIIKACKTTQYEMSQIIYRKHIFRFCFPGFDAGAQAFYQELSPRMTQVELSIDFTSLAFHRYLAGNRDSGIKQTIDQFREGLTLLNRNAKQHRSCRIIINALDRLTSVLLRRQVVDGIKTLVGVETLMVVILRWKKDGVMKLGLEFMPTLVSALGNFAFHDEWPPLSCVKSNYASFIFHPKKYNSERIVQAGEDKAC